MVYSRALIIRTSKFWTVDNLDLSSMEKICLIRQNMLDAIITICILQRVSASAYQEHQDRDRFLRSLLAPEEMIET